MSPSEMIPSTRLLPASTITTRLTPDPKKLTNVNFALSCIYFPYNNLST